MEIPKSIEPFVESESHWPALFARIPFAGVAFGLAILVVLWDDAARLGVWPGMPRLFSGGAVFWGYATVLVAGVALGGWLAVARTRQRSSDVASAAQPRLPVFLRFDRRRVVVVGAGPVAASKIPALLAAGADVTVIAPAVSGSIDRSRVQVLEREFQPDDLNGAWFVTAAATSAVNRDVAAAAEMRGIFVNAVDDPANATAYLGGTVVRGGVTLAFSTAGHAPALAGLLREAFEELLPPDVETWLDRAKDLSRRQRASGVPIGQRRPQLLDALNRLYDRASRGAAGPDQGRSA